MTEIRIKSPQAKRVLAQYLAEHDPEHYDFLVQCAGAFGKDSEIVLPDDPQLRERLEAMKNEKYRES